jgi:hypothetical protein
MSARQKLNQSYVNGALLIAGVIGACTESWTAFMVFAAVFVALSCHAGDIRLFPSAGRRKNGKP